MFILLQCDQQKKRQWLAVENTISEDVKRNSINCHLSILCYLKNGFPLEFGQNFSSSALLV
jgi:hypothetical protein